MNTESNKMMLKLLNYIIRIFCFLLFSLILIALYTCTLLELRLATGNGDSFLVWLIFSYFFTIFLYKCYQRLFRSMVYTKISKLESLGVAKEK